MAGSEGTGERDGDEVRELEEGVGRLVLVGLLRT